MEVSEILDGHIHIWEEPVDQRLLVERMQTAGVSGGILISHPPESFRKLRARPADERIDNLLACVAGWPNLFAAFWVDPLESGALEQVALAHRSGVDAFKVICTYFQPGDPRALDVYRAIAETGKPILFHSGILYDGQDSSRYNRPVEFEAMLDVANLRFSLAHISWPWCDELIALYGKLQNSAIRGNMFVDVTPGTPPIYREDALTKLFTVGFDVENNVFFGTDCRADNYNSNYARQCIDRDNAIYDKLGLKREIKDKVYAGNLKRFVGVPAQDVA